MPENETEARSPDLRHPASLRGISHWLREMAVSLTAHADHPIEVRDIAYSLRAKAAAIGRDPEWRSGRYVEGNPWADLSWFRCTEQLRDELALLDERGYRECCEAPTVTDAEGESGSHLHGVPMHIAADIDQMRTEAAMAAAEAVTPAAKAHEVWDATFGCPVQVVFGPDDITDCTFRRGHEGPHSWAGAAEAVTG
jgi:hypothetical protein